MSHYTRRRLSNSAAVYILTGLIPYTKQNLKLVFNPSQFFKELAKLSLKTERTLQNEFYKLQNTGYLSYDRSKRSVLLTKLAEIELQRFQPKLLGPGSQLMVIFDIPEVDRYKRTNLRLLLKELKFVQIQKSVWATKYESRDYLKMELSRLDLTDEVEIYESNKLV